jgi:PEP-CTERM motif
MRAALLRRPLVSLSVLLGSLVVAPSAISATITLLSDDDTLVRGLSWNGLSVLGSQEDYFPTALPDSGTVTSTDSPSTSTTNFDLSDAGFLFTFDHHRGSEAFAQGATYISLLFIPSTDVDYAISGGYSVADDEGRHVNVFATFFDVSAQTSLYYSSQTSEFTPNEEFSLGGSGGDSYNENSGSPVGTLIGGHFYRLEFATELIASPTASVVEADATGYLTLAFVPEPSTGLLVFAGLLGLAGWRRTRA